MKRHVKITRSVTAWAITSHHAHYKLLSRTHPWAYKHYWVYKLPRKFKPHINLTNIILVTKDRSRDHWLQMLQISSINKVPTYLTKTLSPDNLHITSSLSTFNQEYIVSTIYLNLRVAWKRNIKTTSRPKINFLFLLTPLWPFQVIPFYLD